VSITAQGIAALRKGRRHLEGTRRSARRGCDFPSRKSRKKVFSGVCHERVVLTRPDPCTGEGIRALILYLAKKEISFLPTSLGEDFPSREGEESELHMERLLEAKNFLPDETNDLEKKGRKPPILREK